MATTVLFTPRTHHALPIARTRLSYRPARDQRWRHPLYPLAISRRHLCVMLTMTPVLFRLTDCMFHQSLWLRTLDFQPSIGEHVNIWHSPQEESC